MLYYSNSVIDSAWFNAKKLFRNGSLRGIAGMKVSTARDNPRSSTMDTKVIIFYCGPPDEKDNVINYGNNLVKMMGYSAPYTKKNARYPNFIYYKSDEQTLKGTMTTGPQCNHLYKIRVGITPKEDSDSSDK